MIGNLKPHAAYKDSGQDWLGAIPAHWSLLRAKRLFREVDERSKTGGEELLSVSHLTGVTPRRMKNVTMFLAESNVGHKVCRPGDLVINTLWAWMAALGVTRNTGLVSPAYGVYRPIDGGGILPSYADQLLRTPMYAAEYQRRSTGVNSSRLRLYPEQFLRVPVLVPPLDEQALIVRFLNWASARLDRTILAKRNTIALLAEQKGAIINRAVTRGVDVGCQLKPSGIPWLGEIPSHWKATPIRQIVAQGRSSIVNGPFGSDLLTSELKAHGVPVVYIRDISSGKYSRKSKSHVTTKKAASVSFCQVLPGDVLVAKVGDPPGTAAKYPDGEPSAIVTQDVIRVRPDPRSVLSDYLVVLLNSPAGRILVGPICVESTRGRFSLPDFRGLSVVLPPINEQADILDAIRLSVEPANVAVSRLDREIELIREFRARLFADVVTGQFDVREAAALLPEVDLIVPSDDLVDTAELTVEENEA